MVEALNPGSHPAFRRTPLFRTASDKKLDESLGLRLLWLLRDNLANAQCHGLTQFLLRVSLLIFNHPRPLPPPGYVAESILLGPPPAAGHSSRPTPSTPDSRLRTINPSTPNPWQETRDQNGGVHPNIPAKSPPTSSVHVHQSSHDRLVVKTESQMFPRLGAGARVVAKEKPSGEDGGSGTRPREAIVVRSGPRVISEKRRTRRSPSSVRRRGEKVVAKGARGGLQPRPAAGDRKQRRGASVPYDWNKGGRSSELRIR